MDEFAHWVRESFGLGDGPVTVAAGGHGAVGEVLRLSVDGRDYAVKKLGAPAGESEVAGEAALLDHLAAQGIEVPAHVRSTGGSLVLDLPADVGGGSVRVTHWLQGESVTHHTGLHAAALGTLLAQLHRAAPPADGPPSPWFTTMVPATGWAELRERSVGQPWHEDLVARTVGLEALGHLVERAGPGTAPFVIGHRDLHPDNALVAPDGALRALDWEDAGPVAPSRELAKALVQWHVLGDAIDEEALRATVAAYRRVGGPGAITELNDFAMVICTEWNFLAHMIRVALDDDTTVERREQAHSEIAESLTTTLPTVPILERVLDVVSG